jgi:hypothetical protein
MTNYELRMNWSHNDTKGTKRSLRVLRLRGGGLFETASLLKSDTLVP